MSGSPTVPIGTMLAARWIVGAPLGMGENGEVYEAEEAKGGRLCAVKILHPELRRGGPAWSTFQSEVRAVSALPADAVARVYDLGIDGKLHRAFVVCERVMFPSLARHIADHGPLPPQVFSQALMTLARALDAMHGVHVAHGSVKPQNIFVSAEHPSWARLTDYGLARLRIAVDPKYAGTPGWAAPELALGSPPQPSGDLYALGMIAFFALTGMPWISALGVKDHRIPTVSTPASVRARELGGELDPVFDVWFKAALAPDPAARYSSATEMAQSFASLVESLEVASEGPLSGPGVATAIARPLLFVRNLPHGAQPPPSVAHPFSPTEHAMPAIQQALDAQAQAFLDQQAQATAPTAPAMPAIQQTLDAQAQAFLDQQAQATAPTAPAMPAIEAPVYRMPGNGPYAPGAVPPPTQTRHGLSRQQVIVVSVAAAIVLLALVAVGALALLGDDEPAPEVAAPSAATAEAPAPPAPSPPEPVQVATAQPTAPPPVVEPAPTSAPSVEPTVVPEPSAPEPAVAPVAATPAQQPKPAPRKAPAKTKKCGTFIPCK